LANSNNIINDLSTGNTTKKLISFSFPFMLSNTLQLMYSVIDMIVVGQVIGSAGMSAVSISSQIMTLMTTLCIGFSTGGQILISQLIGAKDKNGLSKTIGTMFTLILSIAIVMTILGLLLAKVALTAMNTPEEAWNQAVWFLRISCAGIIFTYGYNMISAVFRGMGDSKRPFAFIAIASVINLILDLIFIVALKMDASKTALATVISQGFSFILALLYLWKKRELIGFNFSIRNFKIDKNISRILVKLGIPFALQSSAINISMMFVSSFVNDFGINASATFGAGMRVNQIPAIMTQSIGAANTAMVGQNLGAGKPQRARKSVLTSLYLCICVYAIVGIIFYTFPTQVFSIFTQDNNVLALARLFVVASLFAYPAMAFLSPFNSFIQGIGFASFSFAIAILDGVILRTALSYIMGNVLNMGLFGFFIGYNVAAYGTAIPASIYFFSNKWKNRKLLVRVPVDVVEEV